MSSEIAEAFKYMVAEKKLLEHMMRTTETAASASGHGEESALDSMRRYMSAMSSKLETNAAEIKQLLALLDQQSATITLMAETHQKEVDFNLEEIDSLENELEELSAESEAHRQNAVKLTEQLEQALTEGVALRADTLKLRTEASEHSEEKGKLQKKYEKLQAELAEVRTKQNSEHEAVVKDLQGKLEEAVADRSMIISAQDELLEQVVTAQRTSDEHFGRVNSLTEELAQLRQAHAVELEEMRDGQEARISDMMALHDSEIADLQGSLNAARGDTNQKEASQQQLKQLVQEHQASMALHKTHVERNLQEVKAAHADELRRLQEKLETTEKERTSHASELSKHREENSSLRFQTETLQAQIANFMEELDAREKELQSVKARNKELQTEGGRPPTSPLLSSPRTKSSPHASTTAPDTEGEQGREYLAELVKVRSAHQLIQTNTHRMLDSQTKEISKLRGDVGSIKSEHLAALNAVGKANDRADAAEAEQASLRKELSEMQAKHSAYKSNKNLVSDGHLVSAC